MESGKVSGLRADFCSCVQITPSLLSALLAFLNLIVSAQPGTSTHSLSQSSSCYYRTPQDATGSPAPGQIHLAPQMEISSREKCLCTVRLQGHVRSLPNNDECSAWKQELKGLRELTLTIIISLFILLTASSD